MKKRVLFVVLLQLLMAAHAVAHDFEVDGICYRILSVDKRTAEVACKGEMDLNNPPRNYSRDVLIPATVGYNDVTFKVVQVGEYAFYQCDELEHVTFSEGLQLIGTSAFQDCVRLEDIRFPTSLTKIDDRAFGGCLQLKNVVIPANVEYMGDYAFEHCDGVETVRLDDSANRLQEGYWGFAFGFPNARNVYLGRNSGGWAKTWNSLEYWCGNGKLEKVEFGPLVTETPWHFLYGECPNLTTLTIGRNIQTISAGSFAGCLSVKGVEIPASVETIEAEAFSGGFWGRDMALEEIIIGEKVSTIGDNAFKNCKNLKRICVKNKIPADMPESAFEPTTYQEATLYVPTGTKDAYSNTPYWANFQHVKESEKTYSLSFTAFGNGSISYNGMVIRSKTSSFIVNEGTSATVSFYPDTGYKVKSVRVNNTDATSDVLNNQYTIRNINSNKSLEVEFEAIPTIYTLKINATGKGEVVYGSDTIRVTTKEYEFTSGSNVTFSVKPDEGFLLKHVYLQHQDDEGNTIGESQDITDRVWVNGECSIGEISQHTIIQVDFETTYQLRISAMGEGYVSYENTVIRDQPHIYQRFEVKEGSSAQIEVFPDSGCRLASVKVNAADSTSKVVDGKLTIHDIRRITRVDFTFEPIIHSFTVKSVGNGTVNYINNVLRNEEKNYSVYDKSDVTITVTPDEGNRLKSLTVNGNDMTDSVDNGQFSIVELSENTMVEVVFEPIPDYILNIVATGNGNVGYEGIVIRNQSQSYTLREGTAAVLSFTPDSGYRLASLKINDTDVMGQVADGKLTINILANTIVEIAFEVIPPTTYSLFVEAEGYGVVSYEGVSLRNDSHSFTVVEGTYATLKITPDAGYGIKSVSVNGTNVTTAVSNGQYTISNITTNTAVKVEFETFKTYELNIVVAGNGNVNYENAVIRNQSKSYLIREGSTIIMECAPDKGYKLASVEVNDKDVTGDIADGKLTIGNIAANTTVNVVFEAIPPTTYSLTITAAGNGAASYDGGTVRDGSKTFTVVEGAYATVVFTPDDGYHVKSVIVNGVDVSSNVFDNRYTVSKITANCTLEVDFEEDVKELTKDGLRYAVVSYADQTVNLASGEYGTVLTVPATFTANGKEWKVVGVEADALKDNQELAAIIWNPGATFNGSVGNPNLLLYVKQKEFASPTVQNVIVDGVAENIVLTDAAIGNNFYCPKAFTAMQISYEHNYSMKSGYNTCEGWETLVLPFDVTKITRQSVTELVPHSVWTVGSDQRPFWLYSLTEIGWRAETTISANIPYIIGMPNNENYAQSYNLSGNIQFIGVNVQVKNSDDLTIGKNGQKRLVPNYQYKSTDSNVYALNVDNLYIQNSNISYLPGSTFVSGSRAIHPFEAYLTLEGTNARKAIPLFENSTTGINMLVLSEGMTNNGVYNLNGQRVSTPGKGLYIINGKKAVIK